MQGTLRQRGKTWYLIMDLPRGTDGRRNQKWVSLKTTSKREAERRRIEIAKQMMDGLYVEVDGSTVGDYLQAYHRDVSRLKLREAAHDREGQIIRNQIIPNIGHISLPALQPQQIQAMYARLRKAGSRKGGPLSLRSIEYVHAILHVALRHAVRTGRIHVNPADRVEKPKPRKPEVKTLSMEQFAALLRALEKTQNYIPVLIAGACGLRASEILGLRWSDLDLEKGTLTVQRIVSQVGGEVLFSEPKTEMSRRTIPIPSFAVTLLKEHRARYDDLRQDLGEGFNPDGVVCSTCFGTTMKPKSFASGVRDAISRAGFSVRFDDLRHSHATALAAQGASFKVIQERLGHSNLSTTLNIYLHRTPNLQEQATEAFDTAFNEISGAFAQQPGEEQPHPDVDEQLQTDSC